MTNNNHQGENMRGIRVAGIAALMALFAAPVVLGQEKNLAPNFSLKNSAGQVVELAKLRGKVVVVNFWATWCHPCQKEIPDLSKLYDQYKGKVMILGVMADNPGDSDLLNFQSDYMMSYPVVRANSDLNVAFNYPQSLPTTFVFDKTGRRVGRPRIGAISPTELSAQLDELVAQN